MLNKRIIAVNLLKHIALTAIVLFMFSACGKRKAPLPPVERVVQRAQINGQQVGGRVDIVWRMPARNAAVGNTLQISRVDIYRLAEKLDDPLSLTEAEFAARSTLIGSMPVSDADFGLKDKTYSDQLKVSGQAVRLRYAIRFANSSGQKAAFSNFLLVEPSPNVANSPTGLTFELSQESIGLNWTAPSKNLDGTSPPNILGYNVYRADGKSGPKLLNPTPLTTTEFDDAGFEFGKSYSYFVRTVSLGRNAVSIDSYNSETIGISPVDTFKPAPPEALTVASAPSVISLFFAFNLEKDVAGYLIYRSTDKSLPAKDWTLLTPDGPNEANTFQDKAVKPGVVYFYYVVAVDNDGNRSDPSEYISDKAL